MSNKKLIFTINIKPETVQALCILINRHRRKSYFNRQYRLKYEQRNLIVINGEQFIKLKSEDCEINGFIKRLTVRHYTTRKKGIVYERQDGSFGIVNYKK